MADKKYLEDDVKRQKKIQSLKGEAQQLSQLTQENLMPSLGSVLWTEMFGVPAENELKILNAKEKFEGNQQRRRDIEREIGDLQARTELNNFTFTPYEPSTDFVGKIGESKGASDVPDYLKRTQEEAASSPKASIYDSLMAGFPEFNEKPYNEAAEAEGRVARAQAEKSSEAAKFSKEELAKFQSVIGAQIDLQNQIYTSKLESDKSFERDIDDIQSKYPALTRSDVVANMSTTEKVTTALLTVLGGAFSQVGEQNPALAVLNRNLDAAVAQQSENYQRAMNELIMKKKLNDEEFQYALENARANFDMQAKGLDVGLKIVDLSKSELRPGEAQDIETAVSSAIKLQKEAMLTNYKLQKFGIQQQATMFDAKMRLEQGKRAVPLSEAAIDNNGNLVWGKPNGWLLDPSVKKPEFSATTVAQQLKLNKLQSIITGIEENAPRAALNTLIEDYNATAKTKLPSADKIGQDIRTALNSLKQMLRDEVYFYNDSINSNVVAPLQPEG